MRLTEKLRRIAAPAPLPAPPMGPSGGDALPGGEIRSGLGPYWLRRTRFALSHRHGRFGLDGVRAAEVGLLTEIAREPALAEAGFDRAVFFDTETTSLGGGVSTYVFLLGAGYFEETAFVVEQYFLRELTHEKALLQAVSERFASFPMAVSFHGKGFDTPRLLGRVAFHRMPFTMPPLHLDLCLVGRSLYRGAFADCRLQTFEREIAGFVRADDLPGAECPQAFFRHLQGDSSLIPRVFEHNLLDVLTLPVVAAAFVREVADPGHPVVLGNLGAFFEVLGRDREARSAYTASLEGLRSASHPLLGRILERLSLLERRAGRHAESARLLLERRRMAPSAFQPLEDLAKFYEHRARDLPQAEAMALEARSQLVTGRIQVDLQTRRRYLDAIDHRIGRLRRRMERGFQVGGETVQEKHAHDSG